MASTLDFLAVFLPVVLAIVGVFVSIETPQMESRCSRNSWRGGLIIFGVITSLVIWFQQQNARRDVADVKTGLDKIANSMKLDPHMSMQKLADEILKHLPPKYPLTDEQVVRLRKVLDETPQKDRFHVDVFWPQLNGNQNNAKAVAQIFSDAHWDVGVRMAAFVNGHGLVFAVPQAVANHQTAPPLDATRLMSILARALIPFSIGGLDNVPAGTFAFVAGEPETCSR